MYCHNCKILQKTEDPFCPKCGGKIINLDEVIQISSKDKKHVLGEVDNSLPSTYNERKKGEKQTIFLETQKKTNNEIFTSKKAAQYFFLFLSRFYILFFIIFTGFFPHFFKMIFSRLELILYFFVMYHSFCF